MNRWRVIFHANDNQNRAGGAIVMAVKIDFKSKSVTQDKGGHYVVAKGSINQGDKTSLNNGP